jgi:hypothetical protein
VQNWNFAFFKTFRFSSGVLPAGTISAGRLGKVYNFSKVQQQVHQQFLLIFTFSLFRTVFLLRSQLLLSPPFINSPISLDNFRFG